MPGALLANASRKARYFGDATDFPPFKLTLLENAVHRIAKATGQAVNLES